ncbi:Serine/threonine-protein kinase [Rhynchospora pubera]|uniref:Serine/threonine-protein kinase n=1 Tax=Rhynchospora pubera TaxID=906938 RepID=A0AAV8FXE4_9POAL|nr:Serine/threonine-protein kinase [Rhynchospora pubera]
MNNYHVYEAIGNGKHSAVYKGRKKKTIEYYAIKSVDKSQRPKVLREVRMFHSLNHQNILKFYNWYETSAHLWLILEYCVGGDLRTLLDKDERMPESSIHDLALDLVLALQYLHSKGIVYCDLKPSNILMDEYGHMKLCDFGLAQRLSDTDKISPVSMRGTPYYMAPELFQEDGAHSYASDFWALGCVLYECYAGKPPFAHGKLTQLVKSIISDPTPPLPDHPSRAFQNLIDSLLMKDPTERLQWPEICEHSFWRTKLNSVPLPLKPVLAEVTQPSSKPGSLSRNGEKVLTHRTTTQQNTNARGDTPSKTFSTPTKGYMQNGRRVSNRPPTKAVNILRLSRAAKLNLEREKDKQNYRRAVAKEAPENEAEVKLENKDMELDFSENPEEDAVEDPDPSESPASATPASAGSEEKSQAGNGEQSAELDMLIEDTSPNGPSIADHLEAAETPPSSTPRRPQGGNKVTPQFSPSSESSSDYAQVFWHTSDLLVKPVMPSKKAEKSLDCVSSLPFAAISPEDYAKLPLERLNALNSQIVHALSGTSQVSEKQNLLRYLEMLSINSDSANILTSGPVMLLLVKMLRLSKAPVLRVQIASVIGLLIRHSTVIEADLANSGIIGALTNGLRDKLDKLRRFCMAALGELLFYISTQGEQNGRNGNLLESPSKDYKPTAVWQVPSSLIALISSLLKRGEDDLTQLYALRTIDNISTQGAEWTSRFASQDLISNLAYIYRSTGKQESTRLIAGSCMVRLARFSPSCTQFVFEKLSLKDLAGTLLKGNPREQQITLNLLNLVLVNAQTVSNMSKHMLSLAEEKQLVPGLISTIEQGSEVLRGKALLFCALLCKNSRRWLPLFFCNPKLLSAIDRLGKEKNQFIQNCTESFVQVVVSVVPGLLETVFGEIQQLMGARRPGVIQQLTGRSNNPKSTINLFPVILHLMGSSLFKRQVVTSHVIVQLANLTKLFETPFLGRDDIQITLLRILEAITEEPDFIVSDHQVFTSRILPSLCILYKGNKDDNARFLCLKILFDTMIEICSDTSLAADPQSSEDLKSISQAYFLPLYPNMVEEEDPIPMYAQKLLVTLIEYGFVNVSDILHLKTVAQCFLFLVGDLSNANVSNVKLCLALASAPDMDPKILSELRVVRKIGNLLEFVTAKGMEDFLEPTLDLCRAFILCGIGRNKGEALSKKPALLCDNGFDMSMAVHQRHSINDIGDFGFNMGIFLELAGSPEPQIADLASDCAVLLLRAAPRDGTMGFLANLPKVAHVMQSLNNEASQLQLLRIIYALAFCCRQYLAHAMILSIPVPALVQVETFVSALKQSNLEGVSNAASYLGMELERMPHCV